MKHDDTRTAELLMQLHAAGGLGLTHPPRPILTALLHSSQWLRTLSDSSDKLCHAPHSPLMPVLTEAHDLHTGRAIVHPSTPRVCNLAPLSVSTICLAKVDTQEPLSSL